MIRVSGLTKDFSVYKKEKGLLGSLRGLFNAKKETVRAVDGVDFHIGKGEMVGYIGANGAGKSTTIKMMTGILTPTSGSCTVNGLVPWKNRRENARRIGVVFGQRTQLWWDLPLTETFSILKEIYDVSAADFGPRMEFLDSVLDMKPFMSQPVRTLSLGQRMRADLAASLLHNPTVLFLDEPTIGLDVVVKEKIRKAIRRINEEFATTLVLTTHDLNDIEELCSRILIIDRGRLIYDGGLAEIREKYGFMRTISLDFQGDLRDFEFSTALAKRFRLEAGEFAISREGESTVAVCFDKRKVTAAEVLTFAMERLKLLDMRIAETEIGEIVSKIYTEAGNAAEN